MRYSREHKQETHDRIVRKASVRLREKGAHGIGVADLMKEAGLTHGGFYAHFDSREALVMEAFAYAMDRSMDHWRKLTGEAVLTVNTPLLREVVTLTYRNVSGEFYLRGNMLYCAECMQAGVADQWTRDQGERAKQT